MLRLVAGTPGVAPVRALAEVLPLRTGAMDAVAAASSFHWFDGPRALAEIHRVLRPGARLALLWNQRDDATAWVARLSAIVNRREGDAPRYRKGDWRRAFDGAPGLFAPVEEARFTHVHPLSRDGVLDRVASISFVARMEPTERRRSSPRCARCSTRTPRRPGATSSGSPTSPTCTSTSACERMPRLLIVSNRLPVTVKAEGARPPSRRARAASRPG